MKQGKEENKSQPRVSCKRLWDSRRNGIEDVAEFMLS